MAKNNNYWIRRAEKRLTEAEKTSEAYIYQAKRIYNRAKRNVQREIENVYKNYAKEVGLSVPELKKVLSKAETLKTWQQLQKQGLEPYILKNYKSRITRLEQIQAQIYGKIKEITPKETALSTQLYKNIIKNSYYSNIYDVQSGLGLYFNFNKIDDNLVNLLLTERWSRKNYSQRIWGNTENLAETLAEELGGALIAGTSQEKVLSKIQKRFEVAKYYTERLIRTETNHFHNEADFESYKAMGVEEYVFVATLDNRTSAICQELDGKRFKLEDKQEGVNHPPMHPNCRSTTRAYVDDIAEKMLERRAKDPLTGETYTVDNMTYQEWWDRYGENSNKALTKGKKHSKVNTKSKAKVNHRNTKEKQNNNADVQKVNLNYKKIKGEHSFKFDARRTNPNYNINDPAYSENCAKCVPTYEMRRRGYDVEAKSIYENQEITNILQENPEKVWVNPQIIKTDANFRKAIVTKMKEWGDGARCQINLLDINDNGHTFIGEQVKGKTVFIDPQSGETYADYLFGFYKIDKKNSTFYRIDNLEINNYIFGCCKEVKRSE